MNTTSVIEGHQVAIGYREGKQTVRLFERLDFELYRGELTILLGTNGTGKSTLLRTMSATQPALGGEIFLNGKRLSDYTERELARHVGVVLTERNTAGGLRVHELVALGRYPYTGFFGRLDAYDRRIVIDVMEQVGIAHKRNDYLSQLSDGERQKAFIAKALAQESEVILLDEPTAFLDLPSRIEMLSLLHRLAAEHDKTILLSTHDVEQALVLADRLWLLAPKGGLECGVTEDLILAGHLDKLFPADNVLFDTEHGCYYPLVQEKRQIILSAANATLLHWGINLLNRNGYSCLIENDCESAFPTDKGNNPTLRIKLVTSHEIHLYNGNNVSVFSSFADLVSALKKK